MGTVTLSLQAYETMQNDKKALERAIEMQKKEFQKTIKEFQEERHSVYIAEEDRKRKFELEHIESEYVALKRTYSRLNNDMKDFSSLKNAFEDIRKIASKQCGFLACIRGELNTVIKRYDNCIGTK